MLPSLDQYVLSFPDHPAISCILNLPWLSYVAFDMAASAAVQLLHTCRSQWNHKLVSMGVVPLFDYCCAVFGFIGRSRGGEGRAAGVTGNLGEEV